VKNRLHPWELAALWSIAVLLIAGAIYTAGIEVRNGKGEHSQTIGIVIGGLMSVLPMVINAMRNIGQAQAMQSMAEQLGNSSPTNIATGKIGDPVHVIPELDEQ
jgi:hypothetical protein